MKTEIEDLAVTLLVAMYRSGKVDHHDTAFNARICLHQAVALSDMLKEFKGAKKEMHTIDRMEGGVRCPDCDGVCVKAFENPDGTKSYRCQTCSLLWSFVRGEDALRQK